MIKCENFENFSHSIYRRIYFHLDSSSNKLSQIESAINKFIGVEEIKLYLLHSCGTSHFSNSTNIFPRPVEFFIVYRTENDLKNVLLCCKNYFKSSYFHFDLSQMYDDQFYDFLQETKSSPYWKTVEELVLIEGYIKTILDFISETNLPNLKSLYLENLHSKYEDNNSVLPRVKNHSLRLLSIKSKEYETDDESLRILFECFPNLTEFKIDSTEDLSDNFPIAVLPKGLRHLSISAFQVFNNLVIRYPVVNFPLLTKSKLSYILEKGYNATMNKIIYFPNLTELITSRWRTENTSFVFPQLRKLTINCWRSSPLNTLKKFKKLKSIKLYDIDDFDIKNRIDSISFFSFPNLNEFYCYEMEDFSYNLNYDFESDEISKSLVCLTVGGNKNKYSGYNENGRRLQEKRIPFLYKYDNTIV